MTSVTTSSCEFELEFFSPFDLLVPPNIFVVTYVPSNGIVTLWDIGRGELLKTVSGDARGGAVVHARFRADGTSAVRVDEVGTVSVVVFNRRMGGWWGARQSTVLAAGKPVFTLEVLGSVPAATPTAVAQLCPSLVAISTEENTFVVSYDERGTTKPLFRWPPPAPVGAASVNAAAAANAASATASANAAALPCLAWTWHNALPVLARGWGCPI